MTTDFIRTEEAREGFEKIMKVVKRLLKNSYDHIRVGEYSTSIPTSILSLEEIAKADYLRLAYLDGKNISKQEWDKFTLGGKSHVIKLTYMLDKRQRALERWSENDISALNYYNSKLGIKLYYPNKSSVKNETDLFRKIAPKLKNLKEDCFYTSWIPNERKWNYFDRRFPENTKKMIATYLYLESKKEYILQGFWSVFQRDKTLQNYSQDDWDKIMKSNYRSDLIHTQDELAKCMHGKVELFVNSISSY